MALDATKGGDRPVNRNHRSLPRTLSRRYLLPFDTGELPHRTADVLVVGSGIAGIVAALLVSVDRSVQLVTKATLTEANTWYAQGGIAGAVGEADSVDLHLADTLVAGAGLCDEEVVRAVVEEAPEALEALQAAGVGFDVETTGRVDLHLEGGHSLPRVLHSGDATGAAIQNTLSARVRKAARVELFEERFLVDLLTDREGEEARCVGALVLDTRSGRLEVFRAAAVILASGGCGQIYRVTTNPLVATGDGVAAAWRAGAAIADMEFVQFHPTAFDSTANPKFLITEALRGEGAHLLDGEQRRFMTGVHPLGELAPRDVVTREIEKVMAASGRANVWLDARHLGSEVLSRRFPTIWEMCREAGYDLSADLIPVVPAAHYTVGGVRVDVDGRSSVPGLFVSGEAACSGLHGANRLASNSLLEGLVFSRRIARALAGERPAVSEARVVSPPQRPPTARPVVSRDRLQHLMSTRVAVTRSEGSLAEACARLKDMCDILGETMHSPAELELQNLVTVATLVAHAARYRTESRGTHYREDFPCRDDERWRVHALWRRDTPPRLVPLSPPAP